MDKISVLSSTIYLGVAALETLMLLAGALFVGKEIRQLAGWRLFLAFAFSEIGSVVVLGIAILIAPHPQARNTSFHVFGLVNLAAHFFLLLFCCQLNRALSRQLISIIASVTLFAGFISECQVAFGVWGDEFLPMPIARQISVALISALTLFELSRHRNKNATLGLRCLTIAILLTLILGLFRIFYWTNTMDGSSSLNGLPPLMYGMGLLRSLLSMATFVFIFGHWLEQLSDLCEELRIESGRVATLLKEKTSLLESMADFSRAAEAGGLTAALTHELSHPLGALTLNLALLKARLSVMKVPPEMEALVDRTISESSKANKSVHQLRQLFKPILEYNKGAAELIDPRIIVDQILSVVKSRANRANVTIAVEDSNFHRVLVRADDFYTLTLNFVLNALDALDEGERADRSITIYLVSTPSELTLIVDDNGNGIPVDFADQVFNLRQTTKPHGMGVGLWLCHQLCSNRGYSISFNSVPGEGTEFKVSFPANRATEFIG